MSQSLPGYFGEWIDPAVCRPSECHATKHGSVMQRDYGYIPWYQVDYHWQPESECDLRPVKEKTVATPKSPVLANTNTHHDSSDSLAGTLDAFDNWWHYHGSGITPLEGNDHSEHAYRIARISWLVASQSIANH
jgi:hypothetical protein